MEFLDTSFLQNDEINLKGLSGEELEEVFKRGIYEKPEKHHLEDGNLI